MANHKNLKKIVKIIHPEIRNRMNNFIKKKQKKKIDYFRYSIID